MLPNFYRVDTGPVEVPDVTPIVSQQLGIFQIAQQVPEPMNRPTSDTEMAILQEAAKRMGMDYSNAEHKAVVDMLEDWFQNATTAGVQTEITHLSQVVQQIRDLSQSPESEALLTNLTAAVTQLQIILQNLLTYEDARTSAQQFVSEATFE